MIDSYRKVLEAARELVKAEELVQRKSEAAMTSTMEDTTRTRRASLRTALDTACEARDRAAHALHLEVVRAHLAAAFPNSYYGTFRGGTPDYPLEIVRERP